MDLVLYKNMDSPTKKVEVFEENGAFISQLFLY